MDKILKHKKAILIAFAAVLVLAGIIVAFILLQANKTYTVKFYSDNQELLKIDTVTSGDAAVPPNGPELTYGNVFQKWDTDFASVSKDLDIHPVFESVKGKNNCFTLAGAYGKKDDVVITSLALCGEVELSGFDITVEYDKDALSLDSVFGNDENVIFNDKEAGRVRLNYVSVENTTADVDICSFKFKIIGDEKENSIKIKVNKVYANKENDLISPDYTVVDSNIYVY